MWYEGTRRNGMWHIVLALIRLQLNITSLFGPCLKKQACTSKPSEPSLPGNGFDQKPAPSLAVEPRASDFHMIGAIMLQKRFICRIRRFLAVCPRTLLMDRVFAENMNLPTSVALNAYLVICAKA
jgi:hypothetical protein